MKASAVGAAKPRVNSRGNPSSRRGASGSSSKNPAAKPSLLDVKATKPIADLVQFKFAAVPYSVVDQAAQAQVARSLAETLLSKNKALRAA